MRKGIHFVDATFAEERRMSRIPPVDPATARGKLKELPGEVQQALGAAPNLFRVAAQSPAGGVSDSQLAVLRAAGFGDGEIVEIVAVTVLNILTNYLNRVAATEIDFPLMRAHAAAA
jgi:alkylhydroperoxidase family enzyme